MKVVFMAVGRAVDLLAGAARELCLFLLAGSSVRGACSLRGLKDATQPELATHV
jgi:hypothetical protein